MLAVVLALGSSACYGVSNFIGPQLARRHTLVAVLAVSQLAALLACALYLAGDGGPALPTTALLLALLAGAGNAVGLIAFYRAAELGPLSVAAPIGALGAIVPVAWGLAGGDSLRAPQVVGIALAMAGGALAARSPSEPLGRKQPARPAAHRRCPADAPRSGGSAGLGPVRTDACYTDPRASVLWAAASAVAFGIFLTALPEASAEGQAWALFDARVALVVLLAGWAGGRLRDLRLDRTVPALAVPGLLLVAGTLLYITAAEHGQLSVISVLGSLFPVFTVALGVGLLGERMSRAQAVGVAAAMSGVVLIAL